ncbi:MAG: methyltransferase domain-containing protein [Candidatus Omnitrophica bacterium]|nr:methyltransferase domain-containing protein [Candidatus Omnitrophota bacterium]
MINTIQKKRYNRVLKILSIIVVCIFAINTIVWSAPAQSAYTINVPEKYGKVKERWVGKESESGQESERECADDVGTVVIVQDAHTSLEAQENIAGIIDRFVQKSNDKRPTTDNSPLLVAAEGAEGVCDTSLYSSYPDPEVKKLVAQRFMERGKFTGSEYQSIITEKPFELHGAESRDLYRSNYEKYLAVMSQREQIFDEIATIEHTLKRLKDGVFNNKLKEIDHHFFQYKNGQRELSEHISDVFLYAHNGGLDLLLFPNVYLFYEAMREGHRVDYDAIIPERDHLIQVIMQKENIDANLEKFKKEILTEKEFYAFLRNKLREYAISELPYESFIRYTNYREKFSRVDMQRLIHEIRNLRWQIEDINAETVTEKTLVKLVRHFEILTKLINLEALSEDVAYFKTHRNEFNKEYIIAQLRLVHDAIEFNEVKLSALDTTLHAVEAFYAAAEARNQALVDNTLQQAARSTPDNEQSLLIAGGYHTKGITEELRNRNVPYVVITPHITKVEQPIPYNDRMLLKPTPFETLINSAAASTMAFQLLSAKKPLLEWQDRMLQVLPHEIVINALYGDIRTSHERTVLVAFYLLGFIRSVLDDTISPDTSVDDIAKEFYEKVTSEREDAFKAFLLETGWKPIHELGEAIAFKSKSKGKEGELFATFKIFNETFEIDSKEFLTDFDAALRKTAPTDQKPGQFTPEQLSALYSVIYKNLGMAMPVQAEERQRNAAQRSKEIGTDTSPHPFTFFKDNNELKKFVKKILRTRYTYWNLPEDLADRVIDTIALYADDPVAARQKVIENVVDFDSDTQWQNAYAAYKETSRHDVAYAELESCLKVLSRGDVVVDIGAGDNRLAMRLSKEYPSLRFIGTDEYGYDEDYVKENLEFKKQRTPDALELEDNIASIVILNKVLHHIAPENLDNLLKEIKRILKPGGTIMLFEATYPEREESIIDGHPDVDRALSSEFYQLTEQYGKGFALQLISFFDYFGNVFVNNIPMSMAGNYKSIDTWQHIFERNGFMLSTAKYFGIEKKVFHRTPLGIMAFINEKLPEQLGGSETDDRASAQQARRMEMAWLLTWHGDIKTYNVSTLLTVLKNYITALAGTLSQEKEEDLAGFIRSLLQRRFDGHAVSMDTEISDCVREIWHEATQSEVRKIHKTAERANLFEKTGELLKDNYAALQKVVDTHDVFSIPKIKELVNECEISYREFFDMYEWLNRFIARKVDDKTLFLRGLIEEGVREIWKPGYEGLTYDLEGIEENITINGDERGLKIAFAQFFENAFLLKSSPQLILKKDEGAKTRELIIKTPDSFKEKTQQEIDEMLAWDKETGRQALFNLGATWREEGTGLGLALAWEIFQDHGITVRAEPDKAGTGTVFVIKIPQNGNKTAPRMPIITKSEENAEPQLWKVADRHDPDNFLYPVKSADLMRLLYPLPQDKEIKWYSTAVVSHDFLKTHRNNNVCLILEFPDDYIECILTQEGPIAARNKREEDQVHVFINDHAREARDGVLYAPRVGINRGNLPTPREVKEKAKQKPRYWFEDNAEIVVKNGPELRIKGVLLIARRDGGLGFALTRLEQHETPISMSGDYTFREKTGNLDASIMKYVKEHNLPIIIAAEGGANLDEAKQFFQERFPEFDEKSPNRFILKTLKDKSKIAAVHSSEEGERNKSQSTVQSRELGNTHTSRERKAVNLFEKVCAELNLTVLDWGEDAANVPKGLQELHMFRDVCEYGDKRLSRQDGYLIVDPMSYPLASSRIGSLIFIREDFYAKLGHDLQKELTDYVILLPSFKSLRDFDQWSVPLMFDFMYYPVGEYHWIDGGAGKGILSLALLKIGAPFVHLVDINPISLQEAKYILEMNGFKEGEHFQIHEGDLSDSNFVKKTSEIVAEKARHDKKQVGIASNIGYWVEDEYTAYNIDNRQIMKFIDHIPEAVLFFGGGYKIGAGNENHELVQKDIEALRTRSFYPHTNFMTFSNGRWICSMSASLEGKLDPTVTKKTLGVFCAASPEENAAALTKQTEALSSKKSIVRILQDRAQKRFDQLRERYKKELEKMKTWIDDNASLVKDYTVASLQFEAGLDRGLIEKLIDRYGEDVTRITGQMTMSGGLGALMHDLIVGWNKNGADVVSINPLYNNRIKGHRTHTPDYPTAMLGDMIRNVLEERKDIQLKSFTLSSAEFKQHANHHQARNVIEKEIFVNVYSGETKFGAAPLYYLDAYYYNEQREKMYIFDELYPDDDRRAVQMTVYNIAAQMLLKELQIRGETKEKILFIENEVLVSLPKKEFPDAVICHINHTVYKAGLYAPRAYAFDLLGFDESVKNDIVRHNNIDLLEYIAKSNSVDFIAGVGLAEHTDVLRDNLFALARHKIREYNKDGLRNTNGVLFDMWQGDEIRDLINAYKVKLFPEKVVDEVITVDDTTFFNALRKNVTLQNEFIKRFEMIKALYELHLLLWLNEFQQEKGQEMGGATWLAEILGNTSYGDKDIKELEEKYNDYIGRMVHDIGNTTLWNEFVTEFEELKDILFKNPIVSNIRRQVSYKGPDKYKQMLEIFENAEKREAFRKSGTRLIIGGRMFGEDAINLFYELRDRAKSLGLHDRIAFIEDYNISDAPLIFRGVSGTVMLSDEFLEASATSMMKALTNGASLIGVWGGAMPELFNIVDMRTGKVIDVFEFIKEVGAKNAHDVLRDCLADKTYVFTNGFLVSYSPFEREQSMEVVEGKKEIRRPFVDSLIECLTAFGNTYQNNTTRQEQMWEALASSPRVDIERSQARAHLKMWHEAIDRRIQFDAFMQSLDISNHNEIRDVLYELGKGFTWKFKPYPPFEPEEKVETLVESGIVGLLKGFREIRNQGDKGLWSMQFHVQSSRKRGDILVYLSDILDQAVALKPLKDRIDIFVNEVRETEIISEKIRITLEALDFVGRVAERLEAALPQAPVSDANGKAMMMPETKELNRKIGMLFNLSESARNRTAVILGAFEEVGIVLGVLDVFVDIVLAMRMKSKIAWKHWPLKIARWTAASRLSMVIVTSMIAGPYPLAFGVYIILGILAATNAFTFGFSHTDASTKEKFLIALAGLVFNLPFLACTHPVMIFVSMFAHGMWNLTNNMIREIDIKDGEKKQQRIDGKEESTNKRLSAIARYLLWDAFVIFSTIIIIEILAQISIPMIFNDIPLTSSLQIIEKVGDRLIAFIPSYHVYDNVVRTFIKNIGIGIGAMIQFAIQYFLTYRVVDEKKEVKAWFLSFFIFIPFCLSIGGAFSQIVSFFLPPSLMVVDYIYVRLPFIGFWLLNVSNIAILLAPTVSIGCGLYYCLQAYKRSKENAKSGTVNEIKGFLRNFVSEQTIEQQMPKKKRIGKAITAFLVIFFFIVLFVFASKSIAEKIPEGSYLIAVNKTHSENGTTINGNGALKTPHQDSIMQIPIVYEKDGVQIEYNEDNIRKGISIIKEIPGIVDASYRKNEHWYHISITFADRKATEALVQAQLSPFERFFRDVETGHKNGYDGSRENAVSRAGALCSMQLLPVSAETLVYNMQWEIAGEYRKKINRLDNEINILKAKIETTTYEDAVEKATDTVTLATLRAERDYNEKVSTMLRTYIKPQWVKGFFMERVFVPPELKKELMLDVDSIPLIVLFALRHDPVHVQFAQARIEYDRYTLTYHKELGRINPEHADAIDPNTEVEAATVIAYIHGLDGAEKRIGKSEWSSVIQKLHPEARNYLFRFLKWRTEQDGPSYMMHPNKKIHEQMCMALVLEHWEYEVPSLLEAAQRDVRDEQLKEAQPDLWKQRIFARRVYRAIDKILKQHKNDMQWHTRLVQNHGLLHSLYTFLENIGSDNFFGQELIKFITAVEKSTVTIADAAHADVTAEAVDGNETFASRTHGSVTIATAEQQAHNGSDEGSAKIQTIETGLSTAHQPSGKTRGIDRDKSQLKHSDKTDAYVPPFYIRFARSVKKQMHFIKHTVQALVNTSTLNVPSYLTHIKDSIKDTLINNGKEFYWFFYGILFASCMFFMRQNNYEKNATELNLQEQPLNKITWTLYINALKNKPRPFQTQGNSLNADRLMRGFENLLIYVFIGLLKGLNFFAQLFLASRDIIVTSHSVMAGTAQFTIEGTRGSLMRNTVLSALVIGIMIPVFRHPIGSVIGIGVFFISYAIGRRFISQVHAIKPKAYDDILSVPLLIHTALNEKIRDEIKAELIALRDLLDAPLLGSTHPEKIAQLQSENHDEEMLPDEEKITAQFDMDQRIAAKESSLIGTLHEKDFHLMGNIFLYLINAISNEAHKEDLTAFLMKALNVRNHTALLNKENIRITLHHSEQDTDSLKVTVLFHNPEYEEKDKTIAQFTLGQHGDDPQTVYLTKFSSFLQKESDHKTGMSVFLLKVLATVLKEKGYHYIVITHMKKTFKRAKVIKLRKFDEQMFHAKIELAKKTMYRQLYAPIYVFIDQEAVNVHTMCDFNNETLSTMNIQPVFYSFTIDEKTIREKLEAIGIPHGYKTIGNIDEKYEGATRGERFNHMINDKKFKVLDHVILIQAHKKVRISKIPGYYVWLGIVNPQFPFETISELKQLAQQGKYASTVTTHIKYFLDQIITPDGSRVVNRFLGPVVEFEDKTIMDDFIKTIQSFEKQRVMKKAA